MDLFGGPLENRIGCKMIDSFGVPKHSELNPVLHQSLQFNMPSAEASSKRNQ